MLLAGCWLIFVALCCWLLVVCCVLGVVGSVSIVVRRLSWSVNCVLFLALLRAMCWRCRRSALRDCYCLLCVVCCVWFVVCCCVAAVKCCVMCRVRCLLIFVRCVL